MIADHSYFVYIVECSDGSFYTGVTNDLDRRLYEHNSGITPNTFTFKIRPVKLRYYEEFNDIHQALIGNK